MPSLTALLTPIRLLGKHGALAVAASVGLGLAFPAFSALAKPYLQETIIVLLILAFLRVEAAALRETVRRPAILFLGSLWMLVITPFVLFGVAWLFQVPQTYPDMMIILILMSAAPPIMSSPAFAYFLNLNGAISLSVMVLTMLALPLTAPIVTNFLAGQLLPLSPLQMGLQLVGLLVGCWLGSVIIQWLVGKSRIEEAKQEIDGLNVIVMFILAVALMDGVSDHFTADPLFVTAITLISFLVAFFQIGITLFVFAPFGLNSSLPLALATGNRNMGIMVVGIGSQMPDQSWLWFALAQFPIYCLPLILTPVIPPLMKRLN
ncbi:MAG: sodium:proton symporter [Cohaesibacter sp.]|jgi:BASS family bile acid:Na+ symporter|nr:sodium:proton symporter [Cohaesibacter sp.]